MDYRMKIKVNPGTSQCSLEWRSDHMKINLTAPPEEGKANEQMFELLADKFNLGTGDVEMVSGATGEFKTVKLHNLDRKTLVRRINELKG